MSRRVSAVAFQVLLLVSAVTASSSRRLSAAIIEVLTEIQQLQATPEVVELHLVESVAFELYRLGSIEDAQRNVLDEVVVCVGIVVTEIDDWRFSKAPQ